MCNTRCVIFGCVNIKQTDVEGKSVIEIGSFDVNGSLRPLIESYKPREYIGVDIEEGPGVDKICSVEDLSKEMSGNRFDLVIATELLEHVKDWRKAVRNIKDICKEGGLILITTRSIGVPFHPHPYDFWRFEVEDMRNIFSDCEILVLEKDPSEPGVFLKARKPVNFHAKPLEDRALYSIVLNKRVKDIEGSYSGNVNFKRIGFNIRHGIKNFLMSAGRYIIGKL
ncbi:MAG: class I SAM-dependent methyltransferase [Candidatus Omnitrophica bacterium]|nr:class I SAM-dependent methyltransferase [Candidatus Omnitrophota bacterium]